MPVKKKILDTHKETQIAALESLSGRLDYLIETTKTKTKIKKYQQLRKNINQLTTLIVEDKRHYTDKQIHDVERYTVSSIT